MIDAESVFEESKASTPGIKLLDKAGLKKLSVSEIERLMDSMDKLVTELNHEWTNQLDVWLSEIQALLQEHQCQLASNNSEELFLCYPVSELIDRLIQLKIDVPKIKKQQPISFSTYIQMKSHIAIQNQLNQQQASDIDQKLKALHKLIKKQMGQIATQEKKLLDNHQQQIKKLLEATTFVESLLAENV